MPHVQGELLAAARSYLAAQIMLTPTTPPSVYGIGNSRLSDCDWFHVQMPGARPMVGSGKVIGVRRADGQVVYFGTDGGE